VNGVEEGNWTEYYINGNIKEQIQFKNEVFDGERKEYYENGILKTYQNWGEGQKNGYCYYYNEKGKVICEEQYRNGILINKKGHF
jgi:antitoxin component YwqK of YwqJK toxin-antitoxin module